jgi:ferredoxin
LIFGRFLLPFHKAVSKRPLYATLRYLFHACLIVAPLWASGHIALFQVSRLGWYWSPLPDVWTDRLTLLVVVFAGFFFCRRLIVPGLRLTSSRSDALLILVVTLPFFSGYLAYHQWLPYKAMMVGHVLSGEVMLISLVVLFCRTAINGVACSGCAACAVCCPTATIEYNDQKRLRTFSYAHYACIACGACIQICPEEAAALKHEISLKKLFQVMSREKIGSVELNECTRCGCFFAPTPQVERVGQILAEGKRKMPTLEYCDRCRARLVADQINPLRVRHVHL